MSGFICTRCLSESSATPAADRVGRGTFPVLSAVGGIGGILAGLATANPLVVPIGLISGLAGDAVCSRCGSPEDVHAVLEETEDEFGEKIFLLEPPPPAPWDDQHDLSEETNSQTYIFDEESQTLVPAEQSDLTTTNATEGTEGDTASAAGPTPCSASTPGAPTVSAAIQPGVGGVNGSGSGGGAASGGGASSGGGAGSAGGGQ